MSVLQLVPSSGSTQFSEWLKSIEAIGEKGKLTLYNFHLEERVPQGNYSKFVSLTLTNFKDKSNFNNAYDAYYQAIYSDEMFMLLKCNIAGIPEELMHFVPLRLLAKKGFVDSFSLDDKPPREITIKKPLGSGRTSFWVTFKSVLNMTSLNATDIRNLLGIIIADVGDHLYSFAFSINPNHQLCIPSVFDAFGCPPFMPAPPNSRWGMTRNLIDDSDGVPELLIAPLQTLSECPKGYLVEPTISSPPPTGYIPIRIQRMNNDDSYGQWRSKW